MAEADWKRLRQSQVTDYGGKLPARVVLEHDEDDHAYRNFLRLSRLTVNVVSRSHAFTTGWRMR
jgi:hypothetical protein